MSTSLIYHAFGLRDYFYKTTRFIGGVLTFEIFPKPEAIKCPECNSRSVVKRGVIKRTLRTIPVGSRPVILKTAIQRVWCPICKFVRQIKLSFSKEGKSYTRAFERYVLELSQFMTIKDIASHLRISWDTIKQIQKAHLTRRYRSIPLKKVKRIAIDEISIGKGHQYLTIVMDLESGRILHVGDGKGGDALKFFWQKIKISKAGIEAISIDMSPAYLSAVIENMPGTAIVFDRFHVVKLFNEKLSEFRRDLYKHLSNSGEQKLIKGTRWLLLKNPENLQKNKGEAEHLQKALEVNQPLSTVYYMKEELRQIWNQSDKNTGGKVLENWINLANVSDIQMLKKFAKTLGLHRNRILSFYDYAISTGPLEGTNNKIKTMKRKAYGYRDFEFFKLKLLDLHNKKYALIG
ncbi:ISL3 family transposase [Desulfospira joergensenii]|uniref:ISL3 family transposase n=1 Tax=Desulfospira joergensenii TaxID=53329 RepID=UPI000422CCCC|nr:ISL3 family transposase [Desulfospira joergensenii]